MTRRHCRIAWMAAALPTLPPPPAPLSAVQEKKLPPIYRGKWATASQAEVEEMLAQGVPHCYRFRVPKSQVVTIQVRGGAGWGHVDAAAVCLPERQAPRGCPEAHPAPRRLAFL